jgi:phosphoglycolate phosphatase-like HAD superfamily hydrolase
VTTISGKAAGCFVVGITTSFPAKDLAAAGADLVLASFRDLECRMVNLASRECGKTASAHN